MRWDSWAPSPPLRTKMGGVLFFSNLLDICLLIFYAFQIPFGIHVWWFFSLLHNLFERRLCLIFSLIWGCIFISLLIFVSWFSCSCPDPTEPCFLTTVWWIHIFLHLRKTWFVIVSSELFSLPAWVWIVRGFGIDFVSIYGFCCINACFAIADFWCFGGWDVHVF